MRRVLALFLLPLLSLACTMVLYETPQASMEGEMERPSITATIPATMTSVVESAVVCNVRAVMGLNLRSGAGTIFSVVTVLPSGTLVEVVESKVVEDGSTWKKVMESGGTIGWVNGRYLCEATR